MVVVAVAALASTRPMGPNSPLGSAQARCVWTLLGQWPGKRRGLAPAWAQLGEGRQWCRQGRLLGRNLV